MKVCALTAFHGRHKEIERIITSYLSQTYEGPSTLLLYNNAPVNQELGNFEIPEHKTIILVNNSSDLETKGPYTNTGDIFRDAISFIPWDTDIVSIYDSDDIYLPTHLAEGVSGMKRAQGLGCLAYKPYKSYFLYQNECGLMHNTMEPSMFVDYKYLIATGFNSETVSYHQKWINELEDRKQLFCDPSGPPTMMYNWAQGHGNHKISGMGDNLENFQAHRRWERDFGDKILNPAPESELQYFYRLTKTADNAEMVKNDNK